MVCSINHQQDSLHDDLIKVLARSNLVCRRRCRRCHRGRCLSAYGTNGFESSTNSHIKQSVPTAGTSHSTGGVCTRLGTLSPLKLIDPKEEKEKRNSTHASTHMVPYGPTMYSYFGRFGTWAFGRYYDCGTIASQPSHPVTLGPCLVQFCFHPRPTNRLSAHLQHEAKLVSAPGCRRGTGCWSRKKGKKFYRRMFDQQPNQRSACVCVFSSHQIAEGFVRCFISDAGHRKVFLFTGPKLMDKP